MPYDSVVDRVSQDIGYKRDNVQVADSLLNKT